MQFFQNNPKKSIAAGAVLFVAVVLFFASVCWGVPAGHVGVVSAFGEISDDTLKPGGPYLVKPWKKVQNVSVQTRKDEKPSIVPTKNGLAIQMTSVMLYHLDPNKAPAMMRDVGEKYEEILVDPFFKNAVKDVCAEHEPEDLYTVGRQKVEASIFIKVEKALAERGVIVEQVVLQDPILPSVVVERIQAKVGAEQDAQRMEFVLKTRGLEAKAKVIEAQGIADAQNIIKKDLTHEYLCYLWIEALRESAKHNNATIYIPTGQDGMPFFKNVASGVKK